MIFLQFIWQKLGKVFFRPCLASPAKKLHYCHPQTVIVRCKLTYVSVIVILRILRQMYIKLFGIYHCHSRTVIVICTLLYSRSVVVILRLSLSVYINLFCIYHCHPQTVIVRCKLTSGSLIAFLKLSS